MDPRLKFMLSLPLVLALAVLFLILPQAASAGCGGVQTKRAGKTVNPGGRAPLAIGDSTMLLALPNLSHVGYKVNAHGCRGWAEGMRVIRSYRRQGHLPHLVVIALGADWTINRSDVRRAVHILGPKRVLGLVTPRELGGGTSSDADSVRWGYRRYRKKVILLDWVRYSRGGSGLFQPDGLHLTFKGASRFARLLAKALPYARAGQFPDRVHFPH